MSQTKICSHCGHGFHFSQPYCTHCAYLDHYANVFAAEDGDEAAALEERYLDAKRTAQARGTADLAAVEAFEGALADSRAVIARPAGEVQRLSTSDNEGYATHYQLVDAGVRFPSGNKWDRLRPAADGALFPHYKDKIRFAALSLDGSGLPGYGECFLVLRTEMIKHRASVFEENSLLFFSRHYNPALDADASLPRGRRATWAARAKLCVAKLGHRIDAATPPGAYSGILLRPGSASTSEDFVEVNIWGPMTVRTLERVVTHKPSGVPARRIIEQATQERLAKFGVPVE